MNMKKLMVLIVVFAFVTTFISTSVFAATQQDVLNFLKQKVTINGKVFRLSNDDYIRAERFFNSHKYSSEQYDDFLVRMQEVLDIMKKEGKTDISAMTWQSEHVILRLINEGADIAGIVVKYGKDSQGKSYLEFFEKNGKQIDEITNAAQVFKYTGQSEESIVSAQVLMPVGLLITILGLGLYLIRRRDLQKLKEKIN
jgi:hypothetical protein